ncbi:phage integrase SAM-like domain-containing protein, partial [Candidatus Neomarinimicrobiota bacterium]
MATIRPNNPLTTEAKSGKRVRSSKADGWQLNWKDHNGKWRQKVFRGDKRSAEKFLQRIVSEVDEIKAGIKPPPERSMDLERAITMYLGHLERTKRSPATIKRYTKSYKVFRRFVPSGIKLQEIRRRDIERFRAIRSETCSDAGVNIDMRQLKAFFNWCYGMEMIHRSPFVGVKIE